MLINFWPVVFFIIFILAVLLLMTRGRKIMLSVCFVLFIISFVMGFSLYTYSYVKYGDGFTDTLTAAFRGIFSTVRMFFVNDDFSVISNVQEANWLTDNELLLNLFWLCHVMAVVVIQAALVGVFGRKLIDMARLRFGPQNDVYIIKGTDKFALLLGERIVTHDNTRKRADIKRIVIYYLGEDDDADKMYMNASIFGGIVYVPYGRTAFPALLEKAGMGKRNLFGGKRVFNIIFMPNELSSYTDVFDIVKYAKGKKIDHSLLNIYSFTLSDWERDELESITQQVEIVKEIKDGVEKEVEKRRFPYTFQISDEVDLFTRQMIEKYPPYEIPGLLDPKACKATRDFKVLILGFGKVGQRALLRLMINGQFVGSHMRAVIIDTNVKCLYECFRHRYPAVDLCCDIKTFAYDVGEKRFFDLLKQYEDIDYVVVALKTDNENKQTALDVHAYFDRKNSINEPLIAVSQRYGNLCEKAGSDNIFCFGNRDEVYRDSVIFDKETDLLAQAVNKVYEGKNWEELDWFTQESNRATADFIDAILKLSGNNRETAINKAVLTDDEKIAEQLAENEHQRWNAFHVAKGFRKLEYTDACYRFDNYKGRGNILEHCRKDIRKRLHMTLTSWDKLDGVSREFRILAGRAFKDENADMKLKEKYEALMKRDFKKSDLLIVENIPKFLREARDEKIKNAK